MDFFSKHGDVKIKLVTPDGRLVDLADAPFLPTLGGTDDCNCPPGVCLGGEEPFDGSTADLLQALLGDGPADDEFDEEEDFDDFEDEEEEGMTDFDRKEAVAQLGRILEVFSTAARIHAQLVDALVDG